MKGGFQSKWKDNATIHFWMDLPAWFDSQKTIWKYFHIFKCLTLPLKYFDSKDLESIDWTRYNQSIFHGIENKFSSWGFCWLFINNFLHIHIDLMDLLTQCKCVILPYLYADFWTTTQKMHMEYEKQEIGMHKFMSQLLGYIFLVYYYQCIVFSLNYDIYIWAIYRSSNSLIPKFLRLKCSNICS